MASRNDMVWYLVEGFWSDFYNNPSAGRRKFDVQPGGTLTVNLTDLTVEGQVPVSIQEVAAAARLKFCIWMSSRPIERGGHPLRGSPLCKPGATVPVTTEQTLYTDSYREYKITGMLFYL